MDKINSPLVALADGVSKEQAINPLSVVHTYWAWDMLQIKPDRVLSILDDHRVDFRAVSTKNGAALDVAKQLAVSHLQRRRIDVQRYIGKDPSALMKMNGEEVALQHIKVVQYLNFALDFVCFKHICDFESELKGTASRLEVSLGPGKRTWLLVERMGTERIEPYLDG